VRRPVVHFYSVNHGDSLKEATKGYFTDLNATRRHGGKTWIAPNVMIREDVSLLFVRGVCAIIVSSQKALYFPNMSGSRLDTRAKTHTTDMCKGRISVIALLSTRMSEASILYFLADFVPPICPRFMSRGSLRRRMDGTCRIRYTNTSKSIYKRTCSSRGSCPSSSLRSQGVCPPTCIRLTSCQIRTWNTFANLLGW